MKTSKSPENTEVTPSKKKLKQARLPFKIISDVSSTPPVSNPRKRKLSVLEPEPDTKVGKIIKENENSPDFVVISDDESKDGQKPQKVDKPHNPLVNIVDSARKKKLQKTKAQKKKSKSKKNSNTIVQNGTSVSANDVEMVDVEVIIHTDDECQELSNPPKDLKPSEEQLLTKGNVSLPLKESQEPVLQNDGKEKPQECETANDIDCLDDSNTVEAKLSDKTDKSHLEVVKTVDEVSPDNAKKENYETEKEDEVIQSLEESSEQIVADKDLNTNIAEYKNTKECEDVQEKTEMTVEDSEKVVTPKRSERNKAKINQGNASTNLNLNDSVNSSPTTPRRSRSSSATNSQGNVSINESNTSAKLTPKQLQKKLESAKKKEEKEKERLEREKIRQQEKEERAKLKQEKEDQKKREREEKEEAKRKEKEEKEEQKRKEREEKEKQKDLEKKQRELKEEMKKKEREEKEEQRKKEKEAREEERRKKQEAQELEKQEQELKKKKAAEAFVNFFVPKQKVEREQSEPVSKSSVLSSFAIKSDMRLAPAVRVDLSDEKRDMLDKLLGEQNLKEKNLYLKSLKEGNKPLSSGKTWPLNDKDDDDVIFVEDELPPIDGAGEIITCESAPRENLRPKLLSFHENRRPPYWGTWRKMSASIKPRRPFGQDQKQLDYEVDSDEEWEEEQEGESLDGSACGSDDEAEPGDDYEVDNEVFVPHGYLSDEEATMDDDDVLSLTPETQKAKLKHLEDEFESEMKKPTEKLKPRMYGLLWETKDGGKPDKCIDALWNYFEKFAMVLNDPTDLLKPSEIPEEAEKKKVKKKKVVKDGEESPKVDKKKKTKTDNNDIKKPKSDSKKAAPNQPGINTFLTKLKSNI